MVLEKSRQRIVDRGQKEYMALQASQESLRNFFDTLASTRDYWVEKNAYYYKELTGIHKSLVPKHANILEIGCGTGNLLASLAPSYGVGIDFSHEMVKRAQGKFPLLTFKVMDAHTLEFTEPFDYIILSNLVGYTEDIWKVFRELQKISHPDTRIIITNYNYFWQPFLSLGELLGKKMPDKIQNWLPQESLIDFLSLNGFSLIKKGTYLHCPLYFGGIGETINRVFGVAPFISRFGLIEFIVARPTFYREKPPVERSVSIIVPTHQEAGNIQSIIEEMPEIGKSTELIFVDLPGNDGTGEKIRYLKRRYKGPLHIELVEQKEKNGKIGALRLGVKKAKGEIILIYDADMTVPPQDLMKFYMALVEGRAECINGTRLVYPTEKGAMRFLNHMANSFFALLFTWVLGQHFTDTLCGSKAFFKKDFEKFEKEHTSYDHFDRYGDFFLLFHSYMRNLQIAEVPVRYTQRRYGDTKLNRFTNGWEFFRMFLYFFWHTKVMRKV